ncbi:MAG: hypothetical protein ABI233_06760 [Chthoniobacterales bacterium]
MPSATTPDGVGLVEVYDLSPLDDSRLANISSRGVVGVGEDQLISCFIGDVASATVVVRTIGPSLPPGNVSQPLRDPALTVYDSNGVVIGSNGNWQDDLNADGVAANGLAPANAAESATLLDLPAGSYTTAVSGVDHGGGVGLVEAYNL